MNTPHEFPLVMHGFNRACMPGLNFFLSRIDSTRSCMHRMSPLLSCTLIYLSIVQDFYLVAPPVLQFDGNISSTHGMYRACVPDMSALFSDRSRRKAPPAPQIDENIPSPRMARTARRRLDQSLGGASSAAGTDSGGARSPSRFSRLVSRFVRYTYFTCLTRLSASSVLTVIVHTFGGAQGAGASLVLATHYVSSSQVA